MVTATYSSGLCTLSAHACVRARVIMARIVMAYIVTANIVAAYVDTTKYSYGLYTPCACACAFVRTRTRVRVELACIFIAYIVTGCIGTVYAVAASDVPPMCLGCLGDSAPMPTSTQKAPIA